MAKKSKIAKAKKQQETIERYAALRQELKAQKDYEGLRKLPLDARPERLKNRDLIDGRPRGYMRKFGMSRIKFRELAHKGLIPGVKKPAGSPSLAVKEEGAWTTPWIIKKDTFASSSRNAGTRSGRIFLRTVGPFFICKGCMVTSLYLFSNRSECLNAHTNF